jgi:hypothetical protein
MRRLVVIIACFFVFMAGVGSAWASCKQAFGAASQHDAPQAHSHDHADSQHDHSHGTVIHCPTLDVFLLTASFSTSKSDRVERLTAAVSELVSQLGVRRPYISLHGPPGSSYSRSTPPYLMLSVLRI